tara:strand:+ start:241 stop:609 length:369 start_codon:yes stop_codon:yes gene_type:complete
MIVQITTITTSADTAIVTSFNMQSMERMLNAAATLTCTHVIGGTANTTADIVFTCTGATSAETQDNVNKLQTWFGGLWAQANNPSSVLYSKPYVMNLATIVADAGLVFTGADTQPLTTTVVA